MNDPSYYIFQPESNVYLRKGHEGIAYSDGKEIEERLLSCVLNSSDLSEGSAELRSCIVDWPTEYHFSPLRANLLRPFSFKGKRVLELGCGCGAITRFLGEQGAEVVAVEGSLQRARIAAARCRDLPNVKVYCDNLIDINPVGDRFDVVTLIGVLEYSRRFIPGEDPIQACLALAGNFLNQDGSLYVAIENQLGLKYFNGYTEDHVGIAYFGINDGYTNDTVVTFGRKELSQRLSNSGFLRSEFFFPFPDYKLAEMILSECALTHASLKVGDLLCRSISRDYSSNIRPMFNESMAWQVIARNGLVGEFSNSFLVHAKRNELQEQKIDWHALSYSSGRNRAYATQTRIFESSGKLHVEKRPIYVERNNEFFFSHVTGIEEYVNGEIYILSLQRLLAYNCTFKKIAEWSRPWIEYLKGHVDDSGMLPPEYVDCIPTNLVIDKTGKFHYIDIEWKSASPIPFVWVVVRGLINSLSIAPPPREIIGALSYRQIVDRILAELDIRVMADEWNVLAKWEDRLKLQCYGSQHGNAKGYLEQISQAGPLWNQPPSCGEELEETKAEVKRIKGTFSWHITKPLRFIANKAGTVFLQIKK